MDTLRNGDTVLIIWNNDDQTSISNFVNKIKGVVLDGTVVLENSEMITESSRPHSSYDAIISNWLSPHTVKHTDNLLAVIVKLLKPSGRLILKDETDLSGTLKMNGFVNVVKSDDNLYLAEKPKFEVGSKASLKLNNKSAVWKLDDTVEEAWAGGRAGNDEDVIDDNQLLDEEDLKKPDKQSLRGAAVRAVSESGADENDQYVTYFIDQEGRYYYQPVQDDPNLIPLPTLMGMMGDDGAKEISQDKVVDAERKVCQKLIPKSKTCKENYAFVVQDENEEESSKGEGQVDRKLRSQAKKRATHSKPKFTCNFCSYTSHKQDLYLRHMKSHPVDRPHKCKICKSNFKSKTTLLHHIDMHTGVKRHACEQCSSAFTTSGELSRHRRYKHTKEKPHKCTECDYSAVELHKLRQHMGCHTGDKPHRCPHCTYAASDTFKLKRHLRTHTGEKPYQCNQCEMRFTQATSLKYHQETHDPLHEAKHACELCPSKYRRKSELRTHVQNMHTADKPIKCQHCSKSFPDKYLYKMHLQTHKGEKRFKCVLCPYATAYQVRLSEHMLTHSGEKPYVCDHCNLTFTQKQLVLRHINLHHNSSYVPKPTKNKIHACHECKRVFAHKGFLMRHMATHNQESGTRERALALKLGRQKEITENTNWPRDQELLEPMTDSPQYVVIEVEQMEDDPETVAVANDIKKEIDTCFGFAEEEGRNSPDKLIV